MRSDCINDCYQEQLRKLCKVDHGFFMSHSLIRKEYLIDGNDRLLSCYDLKYNHENFFVKQDCQKMCKVECNEKYYKYKIKTRDNQPVSGIYFSHNEFPDTVIKYIPEINFIGFLCNFGGLLGMWLGLSLYGLFNDILSEK